MRKYHIALSSHIGVAEVDKASESGLRPRHFMIELSKRLDGTLYEPQKGGQVDARVDLFYKVLATPANVIALAKEIATSSGDNDLVFANGEAIALPVAHEILKLRKQTRILSFGHNLHRPRIIASSLLSRALKRINRFYVLSESQMTAPERFEKYLEQVDDKFFKSRKSTAKTGNSRPLIVSVGLEQRDYATLAQATENIDIDVKISGFSNDARVLVETFPNTLPDNMTRKFYSWPDLVELYQNADLVVVPVQPINYAAGITSILEGLAMGKPVVASRTEGLKSVLADDSAIEWVQPKDAGALRRLIENLLNDDARRQSLALQGAKIFQQYHRKDQRLEELSAELRKFD